jgi:hypothetical protein
MMKRIFDARATSRRACVAALMACAAVASGCSERGDLQPGDRFAYVAYDASGTVVIRGTLRFTSLARGAVEGEWRLAAVSNADDLGPQVGAGRFAGDLEAGELILDLNPGTADNNVFLNGVLEGSRITGRWSWSTLLGDVNGGRFEAERD